MIRSHLTQALLNYFDDTDVRVRETANTLDAQLLNTAALSLEEHQLRVQREIGGRFLATCPVNLDNHGVYYRAQIPVRFPLTSSSDGELLPPSMVTGTLGDSQISLSPFTDTMMTPAAIEHAGVSIPLANPKLATLTGAAAVLPSVSNLALPIPNRLSFWVQGMQELQGFVVLIVEGRPYPQSLWPGLAATKSETLIFSDEGLHRTNTAWESIDRVTAYGLPIGGTVDIYALEMCLPFTPDPTRPYTHPAHRDSPRNRYWQLDLDPAGNEHRLNEIYYENSEQGFPTSDDPAPPPLVTSYRMSPPVTAIAVEPNTWGMIAVRESQTPGDVTRLDYFDRRESMPDNLIRAGLTIEPQWGLNVKFDETTRSARQVILQASPYVSADLAQSWRYVVELPGDPNPRLFSWVAQDQQWEVVEFNPGNWNSGNPPAELAFPLAAGPGTYLFTLETRTPGGTVVHDSFPYADLAVNPGITLELDLAHVAGVAFDYRQRLWIWDGARLHPMRLLYDGYVFDPASRSLYMTRPYDEVTIQ